MRGKCATTALLLASFGVLAQLNYVPKDGYVPNAATAIAIAVAVWKPIYGAKQIESERPFKAELKDSIWHVDGTLPAGRVGGSAHCEIHKRTGCILRCIHYK